MTATATKMSTDALTNGSQGWSANIVPATAAATAVAAVWAEAAATRARPSSDAGTAWAS